MRYEPYVTFAAVSRQFQLEMGDDGVRQFLTDTFAQSVKSNSGYAPKLTAAKALSRSEAKDIGLQDHGDATWYRLEGSAVPLIHRVH